VRHNDVATSHDAVLPQLSASFLPSISMVPPQLQTITWLLKRLNIAGGLTCVMENFMTLLT
jgi:hypothetical protein